jgi:hypothetical protein
MPFILSAPDPDFPAGLPFVKYVPQDESNLNLENLLEVFLNWKAENRRGEMRRYAEERLSWEKQLFPVVDWLKEGEERYSDT